MSSLVRLVLVLLGSFVLLGLHGLAAQDKKDPPVDKNPFKLKTKEGDPDPFKLKTKDGDPDPFKLKKKKDLKDSKDPKEDKTKPLSPPEDFPHYVQSVEAKIRRITGELQNEYALEIQVVDQAKVGKFQEWQAKQLFDIGSAKTAKEQFDKTMEYQKELPKRQVDIFSPKEINVRAAEKLKIRSMDPPMEYDDKGFLKQWTPKELAALRGNTKLPGYPVTFEALKVNQTVQVFLVPSKKKKKVDDDTPTPKEMPEVVLIVIHAQSR